VRIVEHDPAARHLGRRQRIEQFGRQRLPRRALAVLRGDQRLGRGAPRQVVRFERGDQAGGDAPEVVLLVGGDPRDRAPARSSGRS
jgi:hypothetical protein